MRTCAWCSRGLSSNSSIDNRNKKRLLCLKTRKRRKRKRKRRTVQKRRVRKRRTPEGTCGQLMSSSMAVIQGGRRRRRRSLSFRSMLSPWRIVRRRRRRRRKRVRKRRRTRRRMRLQPPLTALCQERSACSGVSLTAMPPMTTNKRRKTRTRRRKLPWSPPALTQIPAPTPLPRSHPQASKLDALQPCSVLATKRPQLVPPPRRPPLPDPLPLWRTVPFKIV